MNQPLQPRDSLADILSIEAVGSNEFVAHLEDFWGAAIGADAIARAALAAASNVDGSQLQSLHATYFAPLPSRVPIRLHVERIVDTPHSHHCRVQIRHDKQLLCSVSLRFAVPVEGLTYQGVVPEADLPSPDAMASTLDIARREGWADYASGPIEFRRIGAEWPWPPATSSGSTTHREWVCLRQPLPFNASLQMAALVFLSDFYSHWTASDRLGFDFRPPHFRACDHALWVHRLEPWDGWWLLKATSDIGNGGRMFSRRELFSAKGVLIASAAQEGFYASDLA